jgi:two-component system chemotaxis response regulator CheY
MMFKGYKVTEAVDGQEALEVLQGNPDFDLLITDIDMPKMTGLQLVEAIKKDSKFEKLPIIVCSAEDKSLQQELLAQGALTALTKPFSPKDLLDIVGRLLD